VASDTDSIFVKTDEDYAVIQSMINEQIIPEFLNHFGKNTGTLKFKYEGTFSELLIVSKKHYIGNMIGKDKPIIKGLEILRSDASKFQERFQEDLLIKLLSGKQKDETDEWIKGELERFKILPLLEIAFPCKLSKSPEAYKVKTIHVRALEYALAEHPNWNVTVGQDFYYTFIIPEKFETKMVTKSVKKNKKELKENPSEELTKLKTTEVKKYIEIMAFDEHQDIGNNKIDYSEMAERNIHKKAETIYEALGWNYELR
jgi:DNA polymerase elongation subunit (family B)